MVQLAGLELEQTGSTRPRPSIAKIRARWKEAAASDIIDAQIALKRGQARRGPRALRCGPEERPRQQDRPVLEGPARRPDRRRRRGRQGRSKQIVRDKPVKEVDTGTSLLSAAQSALARLSLQTRDFDDAIRRFEELKRSNLNGPPASRSLDADHRLCQQGPVAAGQQEIAAILNDTKEPPTAEERVRGANFYRQQGEDATALTQIDYVLQVEPTNPSAVVSRSFILRAPSSRSRPPRS